MPRSSLASRISVRSLIVACLPAATIAFVANSPVLGAAFHPPAHPGLTVDDNTGASTNGTKPRPPGTNSGQIFTNEFEVVAGKRG